MSELKRDMLEKMLLDNHGLLHVVKSQQMTSGGFFLSLIIVGDRTATQTDARGGTLKDRTAG